MDLLTAIQTRRSVRAYQAKPVEPALLETIFTQAQSAPSNCNTQPWHVSVVSGDMLDELERRMVTDITSGKPPSMHFKPGDQGLKDEYRRRQVDCAIALYDAVGVKYEEKDKRQALMLKNWQFFGAPHAAFISMPKSFGEVNAIDVGIYVQTLMLLMTANGICCCPQGALAQFADPVYDLLNIPENNAILMGLSFGYPATDEPINNYDVGRDTMSSAVDFYS